MKYFTLLLLLLLSVVGYAQVTLPIDFESTSITYTFNDFGGGQMSRIDNPDVSGINTSGKVARMIKNAGDPWGGSFMELAGPIDFSTNKHFKVKVWTPGAGRKVLLKVENQTNGAIAYEQEETTTVGNAWEELVFDFTGINVANSYQKLVVIFDLGTVGNGSANFTFYLDDIEQFNGGNGLAQVNLPITFEDTATVDYKLTDFGGNASSIVQDPTDPNNLVGKAIKTGAAELWAGTTNGGNGLASPIPLTAANTKMTVRVWSPDANTPIRLKVENAGDPTVSVETEVNTTSAGQWETLEFNFSNQAPGTAALNPANTYNKISIFFNFGTPGSAAGEKTYYWDDVEFDGGGLSQVDLPITFEDTATVNYALVDFGGNASSIVQDPTDPNNLVGKAIKLAVAELWAGTTNGGNGLASPIPFTAASTRMTVRVWSPDAGTPILLKAENAGNPGISVETLTNTTAAGAWETLEFDFSNQAPGTAALNPANTYNKISIFFNFGTTGAAAGEKTYYWDDVAFDGGGLSQVDLPITFEEMATVDYALVDFGGNASSIVQDPTNPNNIIGKAIKTAGAELWAGTTNGGNGLANPIPFTATETKMNVRVWSPDAGTPILLKVEDAGDPGISVETLTSTTVAGQWETLEFDFSNQAPGTAALNPANTYDKISIFFNFGTTGAAAGEKTYYWDDVAFGGGSGVLDQVDLPITFENTATVNYALVDFGGNASSIIQDPTNPNNTVGRAIKPAGAELWAGTTNGGSGLANPIPFTAAETKMNVRVWSPDAGTPILLKVENAGDPGISVETLTSTTVAGQWEILEFDFSNQAPGTAALNLANTYDKVSIFFNFGTPGSVAGDKTYYWDNVAFGAGSGGLAQVDLPITFENAATVNYALVDFGGNASSIVLDPTNPNNTVGKVIKPVGAELWAGTTNGGSGLANPIPFTAANTKMNVRVWSPDAGTPILLKVEDAGDPTISVETLTNTTTAGAWETLEFDFSNQAPGTAALNLANTYDKISIFFNFGTPGSAAGEKTYYWDDVKFGVVVDVENLEASAGGIRIYPNPAADFCTVAFSEFSNGPAHLSVFDASGKLVKTFTIAQQNSVLDLQAFNAGMYYLKIRKDAMTYHQKLVIVR